MMMPQTEKTLKQIAQETLGEETGLTGNQVWIAFTAAMITGKLLHTKGFGYLDIIAYGFTGIGLNVLLKMIYEVKNPE